jgi:uncharacterized membrane protein YgcG
LAGSVHITDYLPITVPVNLPPAPDAPATTALAVAASSDTALSISASSVAASSVAASSVAASTPYGDVTSSVSSIIPTISATGETCLRACLKAGLQCARAFFRPLNRCDVLLAHFDCEECQESTGLDQPGMVDSSAPASVAPGVCLFDSRFDRTLHVNRCGTRFKHLMRLCPCAQVNSPEALAEPPRGAGQQPATRRDPNTQRHSYPPAKPPMRLDSLLLPPSTATATATATAGTTATVTATATAAEPPIMALTAPRHMKCATACRFFGRRCTEAAMRRVDSCALVQRAFKCRSCETTGSGSGSGSGSGGGSGGGSGTEIMGPGKVDDLAPAAFSPGRCFATHSSIPNANANANATPDQASAPGPSQVDRCESSAEHVKLLCACE